MSPTQLAKLCPRCESSYPADLGHFYKNKNRPDGLTSYCKPCQNEMNATTRRTLAAFNRRLRISNGEIPGSHPRFECRGCMNVYPLRKKYFRPDPSEPTRYYPYCIPCENDINAGRSLATEVVPPPDDSSQPEFLG
jgi:hypothetical protein